MGSDARAGPARPRRLINILTSPFTARDGCGILGGMTDSGTARFEVTVGTDLSPDAVRPQLEAIWHELARGQGITWVGDPKISIRVDDGRWIIEGPATRDG